MELLAICGKVTTQTYLAFATNSDARCASGNQSQRRGSARACTTAVTVEPLFHRDEIAHFVAPEFAVLAIDLLFDELVGADVILIRLVSDSSSASTGNAVLRSLGNSAIKILNQNAAWLCHIFFACLVTT